MCIYVYASILYLSIKALKHIDHFLPRPLLHDNINKYKYNCISIPIYIFLFSYPCASVIVHLYRLLDSAHPSLFSLASLQFLLHSNGLVGCMQCVKVYVNICLVLHLDSSLAMPPSIHRLCNTKVSFYFNPLYNIYIYILVITILW